LREKKNEVLIIQDAEEDDNESRREGHETYREDYNPHINGSSTASNSFL